MSAYNTALDTNQIPSCYDSERGVIFNAPKPETQTDTRQQFNDWPKDAFNELSEWLHQSDDKNKTLHLWSEAFIRCGSCKRSWDAWVSEHPTSDPIDAWVSQAQAEIRKNGWV